MNVVSETFLAVLRNRDVDPKLNVVVELYEPNVLPGVNGFDPVNAFECFAGISGIVFRGETYRKEVTRIGEIKRSAGKEFNTCSVSFDNLEGYVASVILGRQRGLADCHMVVRLLSRAHSVNLNDSIVLFSGECQRAYDSERLTITVQARQHGASVVQTIPPRTFGADDAEGRDPADVLYEGFRHIPQSFTRQVTSRERRGGLLGLFGLKKNVTRTMAYSSHSDLDASTAVPVVIGRSQVLLKTIGSIDVGNSINVIGAACEGPIHGFLNLRNNTAGLTQPINPYYRFGYPGNTSGQVPAPNTSPWAGNGYYSRTAWIAYYVNGSSVDQDDPAPETSVVIVGAVVPLPDASGNFTLTGFTDCPAYIRRWIMTDPRMGAMPAQLIDDAACIEAARYQQHFLEDEANTDRVVLPNSENGKAGVNYQLYNSTSRLSPLWFRREQLGDNTVDPYADQVSYEYRDTTSAAPTLTPVKALRRRYTANCVISEQQPTQDFLFDVLDVAGRMYVTQRANSKFQIKVKKPADNTPVKTATIVGATSVPVFSVQAWAFSLRGKILVGANLQTSEVRGVTDYAYSAAGNSITLSASGGITASGATLAGSDGAHTPATATLTVGTLSGTKTVTIDNVAVTYAPASSDTINTVGAMIAAAVNANPTLTRYIQATWNPATPTVVTLASKLGSLLLDSPLQHAHSANEEVLRVMMSFTGRANVRANQPRANTLKGTFKAGLSKESNNRVILKFRDASQDYKLTELRVPKLSEVVGKPQPKEINGQAIDNYHQALRIARSELAELLDGTFYTAHGGEGEALLLEEYDVICVTDDQLGLVNLPVHAKNISINPEKLEASFDCRRYLTTMHSDEVSARVVPLPTSLSWVDNAPGIPTGLTLSEHSITPTGSIMRGSFAFVAYPGVQVARVFLKRAGGSTFDDTGIIVSPDASNNGAFEIQGMVPGAHEVKLRAESQGKLSALSAAASLTTTTSGTLNVTTVTTTNVTASGDIESTGLVVAGGGLAVGNDVTAATLGPVTGVTEVFDASGASRGYMPIYGSYT